VNGKVDLGDGSGACGACHGRGADPWPDTGAHRAHAAPAGARPVACETCHEVPAPGAAHPTGRGGAAVRLVGLAAAGARAPTWDSGTKRCTNTYCHDYAGTRNAPRWNGGPPEAACGTCHAAPPPPPHIQETGCATAGCHEGLTNADGTKASPAGAAVHVNGLVDRPAN
jgi:predicted CxxxxCH...CXXCH cytochrome family protein